MERTRRLVAIVTVAMLMASLVAAPAARSQAPVGSPPAASPSPSATPSATATTPPVLAPPPTAPVIGAPTVPVSTGIVVPPTAPVTGAPTASVPVTTAAPPPPTAPVLQPPTVAVPVLPATPVPPTVAPTAIATATVVAAPAIDACTLDTAPKKDSPLAPGKADMAAARTQNARTLDLGNGKRQAIISAGSLNYKDAQGNWQPIDSALVASTDAGYAYHTKANAWTAAFPTDPGAKPVTVSKGGQSVSFTLQGAKAAAAPTACGTAVTYKGLLPGVTLGYAAANDVVEETLTLASAAAPSTYVYTVETSAGLTARAAKEGGVEFVDSKGAVQFAFAKPVMWDSAKKKVRSDKATLTVATAGGKTVVTLAADQGWLKDPKRVYPVTIDPSVTVPFSASAACTLDSGSGSSHNCGAVQVGYTNFSTTHAIMKFDLSAFNTNVTVTDAKVYLYPRTQYNHDASEEYDPPEFFFDVSVRRVIQPWDAACVTWDYRQCGSVAWVGHGGGVGDTQESTINVPSTSAGNCYPTLCAWTVTQMAQAWISGAQPNYGMLFDDDSIGHKNDDVYFRFDGTGDAVPPYLSVTYDDPGSTGSTGPNLGKRPFYTLVGGQITDRLSVGVNVQSGNLVATASDVAVADPGPGIAVTRYYNSLTVFKGIFGDHWAMDGGPDLRVATLPNTSDVILQNNTGYRVGFTSTGSGNFQKSPGLDADFTKSGGEYTLKYHGTEVVLHFRSDGLMDYRQDRNGNKVTYNYTGAQLTSITDSEGRSLSLSYNGDGFVSAITDPAGRVWTYSYDPAHPTRLTGVAEPGGNCASAPKVRCTSYGYDGGTGNLTSITDPRGGATTFEYHGGALSKLKNLTRPGISPTQFSYSSLDPTVGGTTTITDPRGNAVTLTYDDHGQVTHVDAGGGRVADYAYNGDRKVTSYKDASSPQQETKYYYDTDEERLTRVVLPTGAETVTGYSGCSAPSQYYVCSERDAQGNTLTYTYDGHGNRTDVYNTAIGYHTSAAYDYGTAAKGRMVSATDHKGTTAYEYNGPKHELSKVTPPAPSSLGATTFAYDALSRRTDLSDGRGFVTHTTYDYVGRTATVTYDYGTGRANDQVAYDYDGNGNMITRTEGTKTTSFYYDALNRQTAKKLPSGPYFTPPPSSVAVSVAYGYDANGNLTSVQDYYGTVGYHRDQWNNVDDLADTDGAHVTFGYDANNLHTSTLYPGTTVTLQYDASQRLTFIEGKKTATGAWLTRFAYDYTNPAPPSGTPANSGLRFAATDDVANTKTTYTYDALNRLTGADTRDQATPATKKSLYGYGYDLNGNRTSTSIDGNGTTASFNAANQQTDWSVGATRTYTYDGNGNETGSTAGESRTYNARNQATIITGLNGTLSPIEYLDGGQAERTKAGGSEYVNSSLGIQSETKAGATTTYTRTPGGGLVSQRTPAGARNYYLFDGQGSVAALVDNTGTVMARYGYDPYGQTVVKTGSAADGNPFRYISGYLDTTGLYKLGERYYDPARGRFTQLDPLGGGYKYASDDPVNRLDPSGLVDIGIIPAPTPIRVGGPVLGSSGSVLLNGNNSRGGGDGPPMPPEISGTGPGFLDEHGNYWTRVMPNECICDQYGNGQEYARYQGRRPDGSRIPGEIRTPLGIPCDPVNKDDILGLFG